MTKATMMILETEPRPGICFNGHHKMSTAELITKVANPTLIPIIQEIPCAKTGKSLTPTFEATIMASLHPKRVNPNTRLTVVSNGGRNVRVTGALNKEDCS